MARTYLIYDDRAVDGNTDEATVLMIEDTLKKAKREAVDFGSGAIYSYAEDDKGLLTDERFECVWPPRCTT